MNDNALIMGILLAIVGVGMIGFVGGPAETGATIQATMNPNSRLCMCIITQYDTQGNPINVQQQTLRVKTAQQHTDPGCNMRCDAFHGKSKRGRRKVVGFAV